MSIASIRQSPSGPEIEVLTPPEVETPDPAKYLSETGEYTTPAASETPFVGAETAPLAAIGEANAAGFGGADGWAGNLFGVAMIPTARTQPLQRMSCAVYSAPGGPDGGIALGIYEQAGPLLARTAIAAPSPGLNTLDLVQGAGVILEPGELYWLALYCNRNSLTAGDARPTDVPLSAALNLGWLINASGDVPGAVGGFPADVSALIGTFRTERWWIGAYP